MPRPKRRKTVAKPQPAAPLRPAYLALLLALVVVPTLFNIQSSTSFEPDKAALLVALAVLAAVDWLLPAGPRPRIMPAGVSALLAGLAAWAALVTLGSIDATTSFWGNAYRGYGLLTLLAGGVFLLVARQMTRSGLHWLLVDATLLGAVIPVAYGWAQILGLDPVRGLGVSFPLGQRASSTLGNPLYLGDYLLLVALLAAARRLLNPPAQAYARRILEAFILLALALLGLTFSRSAYLGLLVAAVTLGIFWGRQQRSAPDHRALSPLVLLAGAVALLFGGGLLIWLWPRLQHGGTVQQRWLIWQAVLDLMRSRPRAWLMGLGFDTLPLALAPHLSPTLAHFEPDFVFRIPDRAHSLPLDLLVTGGVPWLLGWMALAGVALLKLARSKNALAPWLAAMLVGRAALLSVSFVTHAPDLLTWALLGMALAPLPENAPAVSVDASLLDTLMFAAFWVAAFGFSAAWPGGLLLVLLMLPLLLLLRSALAPGLLAQVDYRVLALLPAILLNQHSGTAAQMAWVGLLLWLLLLAWQARWQRRQWWPALLAATLILALNLPRLGDIAYKEVLLHPQAPDREQTLQQALRLSPYDHILLAGVAWGDAQRAGAAQPDAGATRVVAIQKMYEQALSAQPLAPEPAAAYARWLARIDDPQAEAAFQAALALSPHDVQLLNDQALFWAETGRSAAAIAQLQHLLTIAPQYGPTYRNLAQLYRQAGDAEAADAVLQQGRAHVPWWSELDAKNAPDEQER